MIEVRTVGRELQRDLEVGGMRIVGMSAALDLGRAVEHDAGDR